MADPDRKGGGGLSLRTLAIASAASLTAAMVTSRLFPPGTIYASALTPVIVAAVSEILYKPVDRVSDLRRQRRTMVMEPTLSGPAPHPLEGAPDFAQGAAAEDELTTNGTAGAPPIRIHGRRRSRILHPKVWLITGAVAFVIAAAVLTLPELLFGGAVANHKNTTLFGGGSRSTQTHTTTTPTQTTTSTQTTTTVTQTVPAQTPQGTTPTETTPSDTGTTTTPSGGTTPPTDTGTTTTTP